MPTRAEFLISMAAAAIDFSFPGRVAVVAQRLGENAPFVSYHADDVFPSASTIKLLIAVSVTQALERSGGDWSTTRTLTAADIVPASETFGTARTGSKATIAALLNAMISQSDNTAANVLARFIGLDALNYNAAQLGLPKTRMGRFFMDFKARAAGRDNYTSAADMARLATTIAADPALYQRTVGAMLGQEDRVMIPAAIKRPVMIANKTGTLPDVRHDVAIVGLASGLPYVVAILTGALRQAHGPSIPQDDRRWMAAAEARIRSIAADVDAQATAPAAR
jgi:beta-lactamase class A